jgi:hypothetical protein
VAAALAFREYGVNLRGVLSKRAWDPVALRIDDASSYAAVEQLLDSPDPLDVHAALDALADSGRDISQPVLLLLEDPDPVRRELGLEIAVETAMLETPAVREQVHGMLADPDPRVALCSAASLVRLDGGQREAGRTVWVTAVASDDLATVDRALMAASSFPHRFFVPYLVGLASSRTVSRHVLDALAAHRDHLAHRVEGLLADPSVPRQTRERVVHFLGLAGTPEARDLLVAHLDDDDPAIVDAAAQCLVEAGHAETPERLDLGPRLSAIAARATRCLQMLLLLEDRPDLEPLRLALRDEMDACARRAVVLLSIVHDPRAIATAVRDLASVAERTRSTALEMLEVTVGRSLERVTLALVDPTLDDRTRQQILDVSAAVPPWPLGDWLRELILDEDGYWHDPWLRACAMYAAARELPGPDALALAGQFLDDQDRDVAETARWMDQWLTRDRV